MDESAEIKDSSMQNSRRSVIRITKNSKMNVISSQIFNVRNSLSKYQMHPKSPNFKIITENSRVFFNLFLKNRFKINHFWQFSKKKRPKIMIKF